MLILLLTGLAIAGRLEERISCGDGPMSYALWLPDGWDPARRWPLLLVMDPRGRALSAGERFTEAADRYGWVIASSYDTRSDLIGADPNGAAIAAILSDVADRASIAGDQIALAGFSGTARAGWEVGALAPELVFAILASGGSTAEGSPPTEPVTFAWFGVAGVRDYNHRETRAADAALGKLGAIHRFEAFDGPHSWPPPELAGRMLGWAEVAGQRSGRRPTDQALVDRALAEERRHLAALDDDWERWTTGQAVIRTFAGLRDLADEQALVAALSERPEVRSRRRLEDRLAAREAGYEARMSRISGWILDPERAPPSPAEAAFELQIPALRRTAALGGPRGDSASRTLALYRAVLGGALPRQIGHQRRLAAASFGIAALIDPEDFSVRYNLGCAWALAGVAPEALDALEQAVALGYADGAWMASDPDLVSIRSEPRFLALLERLGGSAGSP